MANKPLLAGHGLTGRYGQFEALHATDLHVLDGEVVAVLGPNGAGKSTLLRSIMGLVPGEGDLNFAGRLMPRGRPHLVSAKGLILVPEGRGIFGPMSVADNLELGAYTLGATGPEYRRRLARVLELFPRLRERAAQLANSLSGGEQQMLAIGRGLMAEPRLLMLDEPSLGLAPRLTGEIMTALSQLSAEGLAILLVEQKAPLALKLASRVYLMAAGTIVAEVPPHQIASPDDLARHYLAHA